MIKKIVDDIDIAFNNGAYLSGLALLLVLPDICGQIEFKRKRMKDKYKYIGWCDKYITPYEKSNGSNLPYINGQMLYKLRCNFLHGGTVDVNKNQIEDEMCKIDDFKIDINNFDFGTGCSSEQSCIECKGKTKKEYIISLKRLYNIIALNALGCYKENPDKYNINNFKHFTHTFDNLPKNKYHT